ncbi:MAG TPA: DUF87 domain-containing protein [Campylobacter avium]|nr:DUF87 domain-containing protein [Campylobacter avium]
MAIIESFDIGGNKTGNPESAFFEEISKDENFVGSLYDLDYEEAKILVNDYDKNAVKGLPHGCFLIAIYTNELRAKQAEGILLRVIRVAEIPQKRDIIQSLTDAYISQKENRKSLDPDIYTKYFYQFSGLSCRVLGTFFFDTDKKLVFGTDLENFLGAHNYRVYKPQKAQLQIIVNKNINESKNEIKEKIGVLRYASSQSYDENRIYAPDVFLKTSDIVARRTAFFGMTRMGKSNTIKIIISAIENLNKSQDKQIGQIVFDINGEYTFSNQQDEGSIYDKFKEKVIRFSSSLNKTKEYKDVRAIQYDFYNNDTLEESFNLLCDELEKDKGGINYLNQFRNISIFDMGDEYSSKERNRQRKIALYKCILYQAKFDIKENYRLYFSGIKKYPIASKSLAIKDAIKWFGDAEESLRNDKSSSGDAYWDDDYDVLYGMLFKRKGSGFGSLTKFNKLHSPIGSNDYKKDIDTALREGKIILVDLSTASTQTQQKYIDSLCSYIFAQSMDKFTNDKEPEYIQMYFEEAHNIFPKDDKDLRNIYNRLAKEGAKLKIGISYSTQEVSSISPSILKNTQNWFISHLNNKDEVRALEKYYDFIDFSQSIIRNNDVGFARIKTFSNNFIIPVQIEKFTT